MATYPRRPSYSIFVRFRRSRLALRRGIVSLEDALAIAEQIRATRFHDRGDVFVVKEPEGIVVDDGRPRPAPLPSVTAPPSPAPVHDGEDHQTPITGADGPPTSPRPRAPLPRDSLLRLSAQVERMGRAADRARAAQARFDSACLTVEDALSRLEQAPGDGAQPAGDPVPGLRKSVDRAVALRASGARSIASFEKVSLLFRRRVEAAWAESSPEPDLPR